MTSVLPDASLPDVLVKPVRQVASAWRFKPVRRNGQPATARTFAQVVVQVLAAQSDTYKIKVLYRGNGPRIDKAYMPAYPPQMVASETVAALYLQGTVQADGSMTDVRLVDATVSGRPRKAFGNAMVEAIKHWRATPEQINGTTIATRMGFPIVFSMTINQRALGKERLEVERRTMMQRHVSDGASLSADMTQLALDSPVAPESSVARE